jgi:hypothetical protein
LIIIICWPIPEIDLEIRKDLENYRNDDYVWAGDGSLEFYPSELEEFTRLKIKEIKGAYYFENGCTITGGEVLHSWV